MFLAVLAAAFHNYREQKLLEKSGGGYHELLTPLFAIKVGQRKHGGAKSNDEMPVSFKTIYTVPCPWSCSKIYLLHEPLTLCPPAIR